MVVHACASMNDVVLATHVRCHEDARQRTHLTAILSFRLNSGRSWRELPATAEYCLSPPYSFNSLWT